MSEMMSQITSLTIVYSTIYSDRSKKTSRLHITGLCEGNSSVTGEFSAQRASNAENASIWWRHHVLFLQINFLLLGPWLPAIPQIVPILGGRSIYPQYTEGRGATGRLCSGKLTTFSYRKVFNPLRAKFLRENINIYLHFMSFLHTNKTQVIEIPRRVRQGPAYSTWSIPWLLMSWRCKEPGHQLPWYWPS